ncbi:MBL fold metallo-hydrolase [Desulfobacter vibrioformis]|uniref:MBL fold metallo-hydrolase n=1 Tax=Desulfobacter vibrioformis TaxID=34031 RepID=UPI00054F9054|nr:MBL fold metallo-hydrolase [Desulfobacter vibrioformis]
MQKPLKKNSSFCLCPLASGSKGNAIFVSAPDTAVLVDAGLSGIEIQRRMASVGVAPQSLKAIIITHEHTDHIKGAGILSRRFNIPVYATRDTFAACKNLGAIDQVTFFECGDAFEIGSLTVNPFSISHDACDPAGLTLTHGAKKIGIATDLGVVTNLVRTHLSHSNALYIEANHDPDMLMAGPYPWHLKQRIQSRTGHLSNQDARDLVAQVFHKDLDHVILAHLSEENNRPEKAATEMSKNLDPLSTALYVAGPDQPGEMIWL